MDPFPYNTHQHQVKLVLSCKAADPQWGTFQHSEEPFITVTAETFPKVFDEAAEKSWGDTFWLKDTCLTTQPGVKAAFKWEFTKADWKTQQVLLVFSLPLNLIGTFSLIA